MIVFVTLFIAHMSVMHLTILYPTLTPLTLGPFPPMNPEA